MQLSILADTPATTGDQRRRIDVTHFKAGDKLEARIVQIASSGRTVLQFSGFKAVVDRLAGGREGDVMLFEVLPDEKPDNGLDHVRRSSTALTKKLNGVRGQNTGPQMKTFVRLNPLPGTGSSQAKTNETSSLMPKPTFQTPPVTVSTTSQGAHPVHALEMVSTWIRRFLKKSQLPLRYGEIHAARIKKQELMKGFSLEKSTERPGMFESERVDRPREPSPPNGYTLFHLGDWPVKMKIYGRPPGSSIKKDQEFFKAIFLLNLEHTGPVRTDIQMGVNQIKVEFFVENENYRANFAKALPELTTALSSLATPCCCYVTVSKFKIHNFIEEDGGYPDDARFDTRA